MALKQGDKAPLFCLKDSSEKEVCLQEFKGSYVVLYFYPKDNTPGCTLEAKDFTKELDGFESLGAEVLGISADSCESHRKFIAKQGLKITLLSDESKEVIKKYGVWKKKKFMGKEFMGTERSTFLIGPDLKVEKIWEKVKTLGHAKDVLDSTREAMEEE